MEGAAKFYPACLGLAVLFFAMFPAHDTIVNSVKVMPLETRVERVVETESDDLVQITQYIVEVEDRVDAVEEADGAWRADADRRIRNATDYAVSVVTDADTLWTKVAAVEEGVRRNERRQQADRWWFVAAFALSYAVGLIALWRSPRRCNKTTSGTPTSAGTPTKR